MNNNLKVLIISHMYPSPINEVAGIFVHKQAKSLIRKGIDVRVISPKAWAPFPLNYLSRKWSQYHNIPDRADWEGIDILYPRCVSFPRALFSASSGWRTYMGIKKVVANMYEEFQFDLIHAHVALPDGFAALKLKNQYNKPVVVTIHGADLQVSINRNTSCMKSISYVLNSASKIICVSKKLQQIAIKYAEPDKVVIIPNGIDQNDVLQCQDKSVKKDGTVMLLSVANLIKTKGIDLNLYALEKLCKRYPMLKYVVIGVGTEECDLRNLAQKLRIDKHVEFLGRQSHDRVMHYMNNCDVFVLPSWSESFGIVYIEAMASGKPVIGCRGEGIEDFVEHGKTGLLVQPKDIDGIVDAIDFLLRHTDEAKAMGVRARKMVFENYTWEKNAERMIKIYDELCKNL